MKKVYILLFFLISASVAQAATWYVFVDGNWNNPNTWTLDASTAPILNNPLNQIPTAGDQVIIYAGKRVDVQAATVITISSIEVNGVLNLGTSVGHDFTVINGTGRITLEGNDPGTGLELNFPAGITNSSIGFGDAANGGTLEIIGTGDLSFNEEFLTANNRPLNDLRINRQNAADKVIISADARFNGQIEVITGDLQINDDTNIIPLFIDVRGNVTVAATGSMSVGNANAFTNLEGGTYGDYHRSFNTLQVGGDFINLGSVRLTNQTQPAYNNFTTTGAVSLVFNGATNNIFECQGITDLYNLVIDKGTDQTYELEINASARNHFALFGRNNLGNNTGGGNAAHPEQQKALYIANGTLRLTGSVYIPTLNEGGRDYELGERAALILDGPDVFVQQTANGSTDFTPTPALSYVSPTGVNNGGGQQSFTLFGRVQVNDGHFRVSEVSNGVSLLFREASPGVVEVNGGLFEANQFTFSGTAVSSGVYGVIINGGVLRVNGGNVLRDGQASFHLPFVDNVFTMTGGLLEVLEATGTGGLLINSSQDNINVTGGIVRLVTSDDNRFRINSSAPFFNLELTNTRNITNPNIRFFLENINDGTNNIAAKDLKVLNDLTIETGTTRNDGTNLYGTYLDLCSGATCRDLEVGGDLTINDHAVLDFFSDDANDVGSSTLTFNSGQNAVFYVGDITSYSAALTGYNDPDNDGSYVDYRLPVYDLVVDKNGGTLQLAAKNPGLDLTPNGALTDAGGKNLVGNNARLLYVRNGLTVASASTLSQIDPSGAQFGYIVRVYAPIINIDGNLLVYEQGINPVNSFLEIREQDAPTVGDVISINSTAGSTIGNLTLDLGNDILAITSDLSVIRFNYRHGGVNLGSHNLKVDILDMNTENSGDSRRLRDGNGENLFGDNRSGAEQYFFTSGNVSDGGLSVKVPRITNIGGSDGTQNVGFDPSYDNTGGDARNHEYQNNNLIWFPVGIKDKYTPAVCYIKAAGTYSGDEYITVRPVSSELQTTDLSGGDILSYYWNVDFEGFASGEEPIVSWLFQYDQGDVAGAENTYVPGKVLDGGVYTRSNDGDADAVKDAGNSGNSGTDEAGNIMGANPGNIIIFNGITSAADANDNIDAINEKIFNDGGAPNITANPVNTNWRNALSNPSGFPLENANYTAGVPARFVGAPDVYYTVQGNRQNWNVSTKWTLTDDGVDDGNTGFPQVGDVAILKSYGNSNQNHWVNANTDIQVAELRFDNSLGGWRPRIWVTDNTANLDLGPVSGTGEIYLEVNEASTPTFIGNTDLGAYAREEDSFFIYQVTSNNNTVDMINNIFEYPNLRIEGDNGTGRFLRTSVPIIINRDVLIDRRPQWILNHNVSIARNLRIGWQGGGGVQNHTVFIGDDREIVVEILGDLRFENGDGNDLAAILVENVNQNSYEHIVRVGGNIEFEAGIDAGSAFDLYNGTGNNNNAVLELSGSGQFGTIDASGGAIVPDLYRVVMNKEAGLATSFSFNHPFNIPDATATFQPIEIVNGTLVLNSTYNSGSGILLANGSDFYLPNTATNSEASSGSGGLEIAAGVVRLRGNNTGLILDGLLRVSGGTLDMATGAGNGNNFIQYGSSGNASIEVSAGTLLVGTQVRRALTSTEGVLQYNQTGGTARFGISNPPSATRGVFEVLNAGSSFVLTGGNFEIVQDNNSASVASLRLTPTTSNIAAGQVIRIGTAATPANQNNFGVQSSIKLPNLTVGDFNNPTVKLYSLPLEADVLVVGAGGNGNFNANGFNVTINELLNNNGTYVTSGNVNNAQLTLFPTSVPTSIQGSGTTTFFNFEKNGTEELSITKDVAVTGLTTIVDGTLNTNSSAFFAQGDVIHDATHTSVLELDATVESGFILNGSQKQLLGRSASGQSIFGMLRISNVSGVEMVDSEENFSISQKLTLAAGKFEIGGNLLVFPVSAYIENATGGRTRADFNINNMIQTNSSVRDFGVRKFFDTATDGLTSFAYPVGLTNYTPVVFNRNTTNINGSITVRPVADIPPIAEDSETTDGCSDPLGDIVDSDNVLQYYWIVNAQGITNLQGGMQMYYDDGTVTSTSGYTEANYGSAKLYNSDVLWFKDYNVNSVDETNNIVNFQFVGNSDATISGIYTAGVIQDGTGLSLCGAIPDELPEFITITTGQNVYFNGVSFQDGIAPPPATAVDVVVRSGFTLQLDQNNIRTRQIRIEAGAVLELVSGVQNTNLGFVTGEGTIKFTVNGTDPLSFPAGDYSGFFPTSGCAGGGGLELSGNGNYSLPGDIPVLRRLVFSGTGLRNISNNLTICEDMIVDGPNVNNLANRNIDVNGNLFVISGAFFMGGGSITVNGNTTIDEGNLDGQTADLNFIGDLIINGVTGRYSVGSSGLTSLYGDLSLVAGTYDGGAGAARTDFRGTNLQIVSGNFIGSNRFHRMRLNKPASNVSIIDNIEIGNILFLTRGLLIVENGSVQMSSGLVSPVGGSSISYVNGKVSKPLNAEQSFTFPIGSATRWRPATIRNVNAGYTWEAQFFAADVVANTIVDDMSSSDPLIATIQQGEYYVISDNAASGGVASSVELSWGVETDVSTNPVDFDKLRVMTYNTGTSEWDNLGGVAPVGSATAGSIRSSASVTFSERIFVLGSTTSNNPLPVELVFFNASNSRTSVELEWQTASEFNNDFFEVQRSFDGKAFEVIGIVEGNGTTNQTINYDFIDYSPLAGDSYYRLRQVDYNGDFEYSPVAKVTRVEETNLMVVPNPTITQNINLRLSGFHGEQEIHVKIYDVTGKLFYSGIHEPLEIQQDALPVSTEMRPGIYMVEVVQGNTKKQVRLAIR